MFRRVRDNVVEQVHLWRVRARMARKRPELVCRKGVTKLCIEAYPRSANTFAVRLFHLVNDAPVGHHTHSIGNVALALAYGIPVLILMRDPLDAVASLCVYRERGMDKELEAWIAFYSHVEKHKDEMVVAGFDEVIEDFNAVLTRVNNRFGTSFVLIPDLEAAQKQVFEDIKAASVDLGKGDDQISVPAVARDEAKAEYRALLERHPRVSVALDLYRRLLDGDSG
jgi:hypothetical protein